MSISGFFFWLFFLAFDLYIIYRFSYSKGHWDVDGDNAVLNGSIVGVSIILLIYIVGLFGIVELLVDSVNKMETAVLFSVMSGLLGVIAAILAIFTPYGKKYLLSFIVLSSAISNISANLAKFYIIDVHSQRLLNDCDNISNSNEVVCEFLKTSSSPVDSYALWVNISVAAAAICMYGFMVMIFYWLNRVLKEID